MDPELIELKEQIALLHAELKLLNAKKSGNLTMAPNPWLPLKEASALLKFESPRALKQRIQCGKIPPDCCQRIPSATGKRTIYLVNVQRYLKRLN